jgi:predicted Zn-dependent peptidase
MGIESSDSMTSFIGEQYLLTGKIKTLEDILQAYQKVTIDEINQIKNMLSDDKLYMYHIQ